jgi:hypothetical protein
MSSRISNRPQTQIRKPAVQTKTAKPTTAKPQAKAQDKKGSWLKPGADGHIRKSGTSSFEHKKQWGTKSGDQSYSKNTTGPKVNKTVGKLLDKGPSKTYEGTAEKSKTFAQGKASFENKKNGVSGSGSYNVGATAKATGKAKIGLSGVQADGRAEAGVSAEAKGNVKFGKGPVKGEVNGTVSAKAKVSVDGSVTIDPKKGTYHAKVGGEAFAGVKAKVDGSVNLGKHAKVGAHAEAQAGIGASFNAEAGIKNGRLKAKFSAGAALGIGGKAGFEVDINVKPVVDAAKKVKAAGQSVVNKAKEVGNGIKKLFGW